MPKWWPWGRSKHPDSKPAIPPAPATRTEPAWHRLPAVKRTVGDIEPTAHLQGFTESLTTSQNPGFTGSLELLAAERPDLLPVLDVVRDSVSTVGRPAPNAEAPTSQSRTWAPRIPAVQRARVGSETTIQRSVDSAVPQSQVYPVEEAGVADAAPRSMVCASDPDDRRTLDVAEQHWPADELQSDTLVASSSITAPQRDPVSPEAHQPAVPAVPPAVQRMPSDADPVPTVAQRVSSTPPTRAGDSFGPLRHLPPVQRPVTEHDTTPAGVTSPRNIPVLRTLDSAAADAKRGEPDAVTTPPDATTPPDTGITLQRAVEPDPVHTITADSATPPPADQAPPSTAAQSEESAIVRTVDTPKSLLTPLPAIAAQRITSNTPEHKPGIDRRQVPHPVESSLPRAHIQRLPVVEDRPIAPVDRTGSARQGPDSSVAQRWASASPPPGLPTETIGPARLQVDRGAVAPHTGGLAARGDTAPSEVHPADHPAEPQHAAPFPPEPGVVQRITLPVVEPAPRPRSELSSTSGRSESSVTSVVQRAATGRRLVVLPPVRRSSGDQEPAGDSSSAPARSVVFNSPRPLGLQRMFQTPTKRTDTATGFGSVSSPSAGRTSSSFGTADSSTGDSDAGAPQFETSEPGYDATTNTITFSSPTVQREPEGAPAPPEPAAAAAPAPTMTAAPAAAPATGDVDELVNRLYDPLAARLRAELWLDRERAGVLMDLGR